MNIIAWLKSKTFWGIFIAVFGAISDPSILAFFPANVSHIITVIGIALTGLGLRSAIAVGPTVAGQPVTPAVVADKAKVS